jgi:hypothetical protein
MTNRKRKKKITDFDFEAYERSVEKRLNDLDFKGIIQDTFDEFIADAGYRSILNEKDDRAKKN